MIPADYCSDSLGAGSYPEPPEEKTEIYSFDITLTGTIKIEATNKDEAIEILRNMSRHDLINESENITLEEYE